GRAGKDKRLAYVEYGAKLKPCLRADCSHAVGSEGCSYDDRDAWWQANCALWGGRIGEDSLADQRNSMPPEEWAREFLSQWEDPMSVGGALDFAKWKALADPDAERGDDAVFGAHVGEDRSAWIAVAWWRDAEEDEEQHAQVMLVNDGHPLPAYRLVDECKRLVDEWGGPVLAPKEFADDLDEAGVEALPPLSVPDFAAACGQVVDMLTEGTLHHGNQPALTNAVRVAEPKGKAFAVDGHPEMGPLGAATRALRGLLTYQSGFAIY
ncbi:MAG: hypothetical protein HOV66_22845, partial [Streptomycetaceae bacterium]|nr:hypothetical protein [Streptomycetaceae bacterium]